MGARFSRLLLLVALVVAVPGGRAGAAPKDDPAGNNGTVKIDQSDPPDMDRGNEPIGDNCVVSLKFYGFDLNQKANITFNAHPPSGRKVLLVDKGDGTGKLISDDAAGGGQDADEVITYDLTSAVQGLKANAQHGYHVKLSVDVKGAPGGSKHKVFWIKCPAPAAAIPRTAAAAGTAGSSAAAGTTGSTGAAAASPGASVLGATATKPQVSSALPRTGREPLPLAATGMWSLAAGGLALVAGRRLRRS